MSRHLMGQYILVDHEPVRVTDLMEWAKWFEEIENRIVKQETVGPYYVSTVFLGLDHNFSSHRKRGGRPVLFETMVFTSRTCDKSIEYIQERCCTWDEAVAQHEAIVKHLERTLSPARGHRETNS